MGNGSSSGAKTANRSKTAEEETITAEEKAMLQSVNAVMRGDLCAIPEEHGKAMLKKGFDFSASDGNTYHFGNDLVLKYEQGIKQDGSIKKEGADNGRFRHLSYATNALKSPKSEIYEQHGKINQRLFLCRQSENTATAVYVNSDNKAVRSYVYTSRSESRVDKFMEARKKNYKKA